MQLTGAKILWESLVREGVDLVFGYPGGAILPAYDAMLDYPVRHVLVRHEQGAAHMADGFARASGRVGVAVATSGPGATNLTTGIATAMLDSIPTVFITGRAKRRLISATRCGLSWPWSCSRSIGASARIAPIVSSSASSTIFASGRSMPVLPP